MSLPRESTGKISPVVSKISLLANGKIVEPISLTERMGFSCRHSSGNLETYFACLAINQNLPQHAFYSEKRHEIISEKAYLKVEVIIEAILSLSESAREYKCLILVSVTWQKQCDNSKRIRP